MDPHARLKELGIALPKPVAPVANYVPFVFTGNLLAIAGQVSKAGDGAMITGPVPSKVSVEDAVKAAKLCGINIIAQINAALEGDLTRVKRIVRLGVFVNCTPDFTDQPKVGNGASDLMVAVFGDAGRHARAAVGTNALPLGATVEVDALVEVN
jgi:enamine deaminase RidA (YjgF/YER057c/UK114 family)